MSGIFKGDSIYKSGGGGGGFKDGGALVDGDFIKVENNTISSYDNVSRDPVNFYFEVKDGEILNSVVELTTAVNATINVYVVKNGFYYLLGNVGGNTVNAGDDYNLNVVGNSFMLEVVTPAPSDPEAVIIEGSIYPLVKIGGVVWSTVDLKGFDDINHVVDSYGGYGGLYFYGREQQSNLNSKLARFSARLPTYSECYTNLYTACGGNDQTSILKIKSTDVWNGNNGANPGTNELGLNLKPWGKRPVNYGNYNAAGWAWQSYHLYDGGVFNVSKTIGTAPGTQSGEFFSVRFVIDL